MSFKDYVMGTMNRRILVGYYLRPALKIMLGRVL